MVQPALQDDPRRSRTILGPRLADNRPYTRKIRTLSCQCTAESCMTRDPDLPGPWLYPGRESAHVHGMPGSQSRPGPQKPESCIYPGPIALPGSPSGPRAAPQIPRLFRGAPATRPRVRGLPPPNLPAGEGWGTQSITHICVDGEMSAAINVGLGRCIASTSWITFRIILEGFR